MVPKANRKRRSQARRAAALQNGEAIRAKRGGAAGGEPQKVEWYWKALAGLLLLCSALAAVAGLVRYFPQRSDASQYLAAVGCPLGPVQGQANCVQWVVGQVTGNQMHKSQDMLSLRNLPELDFTNPAGQITSLHAGEQIQLSMWHGQPQAVSVNGQLYYADESLVQRPMHDLAIAMFGAAGLFFTANVNLVPLLRRRRAGKRLIRATRWALGGLSAGLLIEGVSTVLTNTLWGAPSFVVSFLVLVGALTAILLGLWWIIGKIHR